MKSIESDLSPVPQINYVIEYQPGNAQRVENALQEYTPKVSTLIDMLTISVPKSSECSLLELLASVPGITYHQAVPRKILKEETR